MRRKEIRSLVSEVLCCFLHSLQCIRCRLLNILSTHVRRVPRSHILQISRFPLNLLTAFHQYMCVLNNDISSTCPHNMVNFGPLTPEIGLRVWDTEANFKRVSRLRFVTAPTLRSFLELLCCVIFNCISPQR